MTFLARAAAFAAAFTLVAGSLLDAQSSTIRVTIGGGPHAGTYEMSDQCDLQPNSYPAMHIARYEIFAIPRELSPSAPPLRGRGTVTVKQAATGRTATFRGQTKDGVRIEGTVDCRSQSS
jgi:hypothetical protein